MSSFINGLDWSILTDALISVIPALICIVLHECAHGYVAYLLGDDTAKRMGRLSLNPIKHIDLFGLVLMAIFHFGWAKPVPIDMRKFKNPKIGMAICAAAGPVMNLLIAFIFLSLYAVLLLTVQSITALFKFVLNVVYDTAVISINLAVFNIIPIPPLDGSKVLFSFLPNRIYTKLMRYERYGILLLFALIFSGILNRPLNFLVGKLYGMIASVIVLIFF